MTVVLIPGGLWEPASTERFWTAPGVTARLRDRFPVALTERLPHPNGWAADTAHVAAQLPAGPLTLIAASNACGLAARLAAAPGSPVRRLLLAWPATCGDPELDARTRTTLTGANVAAETIGDLLAGGVLRGVADEDLAALRIPVAVTPSLPPNRSHQRGTVDALLGLVAGATELPGSPEPPVPAFAGHVERFCSDVADWIDGG